MTIRMISWQGALFGVWIYNEIKARSRDKAPSLVQDDQSDVRGRPPRKNGMSNGVAQFIRGIIIINKTINKAVRFINFSWCDSSRPIHWHAHTTTTISISNNPTNTNPTTTPKWQGCRTRWWRSKGSTTVIIATKRSRRRGGPASSRASPKGEDDDGNEWNIWCHFLLFFWQQSSRSTPDPIIGTYQMISSHKYEDYLRYS